MNSRTDGGWWGMNYSARCEWCQSTIDCNEPQVLHDWQANHGPYCPMNPPLLLARIEQLERTVRQLQTHQLAAPGQQQATVERQHHAHD